ncbi:MAG: hypothetical protein JWP38_1962 [Herbaspirillum sp.]|nr:hypothetical protein [Herbaspirillum sp.]
MVRDIGEGVVVYEANCSNRYNIVFGFGMHIGKTSISFSKTIENRGQRA